VEEEARMRGWILAVFMGLALAQEAPVRALGLGQMEALLRGMGLEVERVVPKEGTPYLRLGLGGLEKVWLYPDYCLEAGCQIYTLQAGFEGEVGLEEINAFNRDHRFGRAYLSEGAAWLESDLDLSGGVTPEAVREWVRTFEELLAAFMEAIGFAP
jgi:hypothetical protein